MPKAKRALISVSNKEGVVAFARELKKLGFEIVSTGGTAKFLKKAGVKVIDVEELTGYPKMLNGRVKSLHPAVHAGILADRSKKSHMNDLRKFKIVPIDIVVCNLYPFEEVTAKPKFKHEDAIENIDIGGPTMVRAAAKNYKDVAIIVDPEDYDEIVEELKKKKGKLNPATKENLALKAFKHSARYDVLIQNYLLKKLGDMLPLPPNINIALDKIQALRYGENPHQQGAFYKELGWKGFDITAAKQLHGKELSFNNIMDLDAAWEMVNYFTDPAVAIIKHSNPCGLAKAKDILSAYKKAYASDPVSAFGSIIAFNRKLDAATAKGLENLFVEAVIAPGYMPSALKILKRKKNLRIMAMPAASVGKPFKGLNYKRVSGGFLVQSSDIAKLTQDDIKVVTKKQPSVLEMQDLFFAWGVVKYVKSNAVVIAKNGATVGIGAGQMSRVDAVKIALSKAGERVRRSVLASDAFFPFRDSIDLAARAGVRAIIQPGGSIRDAEVIRAADEHGITMVFTGRRHFRH